MASDPSSSSQPQRTSPYQAPASELGVASDALIEMGSVAKAVAGDWDFSIGEIIGHAWSVVKGSKRVFLAGVLLYYVIAVGVQVLTALLLPPPELAPEFANWPAVAGHSLLPGLLSLPLSYPLMIGMIMYGARRAAGQDPDINELFAYYRQWVPLAGLAVVTTVLSWIGLALLILPGVYLGIAFSFAGLLMADKKMGIGESLRTSLRATNHDWFKIFFFYIFLVVIVIFSALPLFIGLIWTLPLAVLAYGTLYCRIFGLGLDVPAP